MEIGDKFFLSHPVNHCFMWLVPGRINYTGDEMDCVLRGSLNQIHGVLAGVLVACTRRLEGGMLVPAKPAKRVTARSYYMPSARDYISSLHPESYSALSSVSPGL